MLIDNGIFYAEITHFKEKLWKKIIHNSLDFDMRV